MVGQVPASYYELKFSQSDIDVAVAKERERCAKVVEEYRGDHIVAAMIRDFQDD